MIHDKNGGHVGDISIRAYLQVVTYSETPLRR
jgi:hypothetical protein